MARSTRSTGAATQRSAAAAQQVSVWEDDPEPGVRVTRPLPDPAKRPLAYNFPGRAPTPGGAPGTASFRYWTAAECLRRGADFWAPRMPSGNWQPGASLRVLLDEGVDLNAYYDRRALNFFHGPSPSGTVYSGESPDVACHEMGHAILDSIKPQLWGAASHEAAAFHRILWRYERHFVGAAAAIAAHRNPAGHGRPPLPQLAPVAACRATRNRHPRSVSRCRGSRLPAQCGQFLHLSRPDNAPPDGPCGAALLRAALVLSSVHRSFFRVAGRNAGCQSRQPRLSDRTGAARGQPGHGRSSWLPASGRPRSCPISMRRSQPRWCRRVPAKTPHIRRSSRASSCGGRSCLCTRRQPLRRCNNRLRRPRLPPGRRPARAPTWTRLHCRLHIMVSINRCWSRPRRIRGSFSRPRRRQMQVQWTRQVRSLLLAPLSMISSAAGGLTTRASGDRRRGSSTALASAPTSWYARAVPCDCAGCCLIAVCSIARVRAPLLEVVSGDVDMLRCRDRQHVFAIEASRQEGIGHGEYTSQTERAGQQGRCHRAAGRCHKAFCPDLGG